MSMATEETRSDPQRMLRQIEQDMRSCAGTTGRDILSPRVLAAMAAVPRHHFISAEQAPFAYENRPLAIGQGQTISQPFIVALMTDMLDLQAEEIVLEIGTGSGYQAAVLARLVRQVYSVETLPLLAQTARTRLEQLGYRNVEILVGDGRQGWAEHAPYDAIMVTAATPAVPPSLLDQLKTGGRLMIPLGHRHATQELTLITKGTAGRISRHGILPVAFVPLTGGESPAQPAH